jgi:hypothetical protein
MTKYEFEPLTGTPWRVQTRQLGNQVWHRVHADKLALDVVVRLGVGEEGRLGCTGVMLGITDDREVTARALRTVPLGEIMTAVAAFVSGVGAGDDPLSRAVMKHYGQELLAGTAGGLETQRRPQRPGPSGWTDEHYAHVAKTYREALRSAPRGPVKSSARTLNASESTVRRWIKTARDRGLLGESVPGKAGETATSKRRKR